MATLQDQLAAVSGQIELAPPDPDFRLKELIRKLEKRDLPSIEARIAAIELEELLKHRDTTDYHRYDPSPARTGRLRGAGAPYLVVNAENRALKAVSLPSVANAQAALSPGRKVIDMRQTPRHNRRWVQNVLATRLSTSSHAESPVVLPKQLAPKSVKESIDRELQDRTELLDEMRTLVNKLRLGDQTGKVLQVVSQVATMAGRESALDLLRDIEFLLYTSVYDSLTDQVIANFNTAQEASAYLKQLLELPPEECQILSGNGKPTGHYRYRTVRPGFGD